MATRVSDDEQDDVRMHRGSRTPEGGRGNTRMEEMLADLGKRLGLFEELANHGPETCPELAARTGLDEACVGAWLGAMAEKEYLVYHADTCQFDLATRGRSPLTGAARPSGPPTRTR